MLSLQETSNWLRSQNAKIWCSNPWGSKELSLRLTARCILRLLILTAKCLHSWSTSCPVQQQLKIKSSSWERMDIFRTHPCPSLAASDPKLGDLSKTSEGLDGTDFWHAAWSTHLEACLSRFCLDELSRARYWRGAQYTYAILLHYISKGTYRKDPGWKVVHQKRHGLIHQPCTAHLIATATFLFSNHKGLLQDRKIL